MLTDARTSNRAAGVLTDHRRSAALRAAAEVLGAALLMVAAAQVAIPVPGTPVPMTLQSFAMLLTGLALSPGRAVAAMLLYVACGTAYGPCFAASSGGLAGYTGGYLAGFVLGAWLTSAVRGGPAASATRMVVAGLVGSAALFTLGMIWQSAYLGGNLFEAARMGLVPFAAKDLVQLATAVAMVRCVPALRRG